MFPSMEADQTTNGVVNHGIMVLSIHLTLDKYIQQTTEWRMSDNGSGQLVGVNNLQQSYIHGHILFSENLSTMLTYINKMIGS